MSGFWSNRSKATGIIFGTTGYDVERELIAYADVAGLR
jgi:hypothetical protein